MKIKTFWRRVGVGSASTLVLLGVYAESIGSRGRGVIAEALADPMSVFAARSPGVRAPGALTQTKPALASNIGPSAPFAPSERVLSNVRTRPAAPIEAGLPGAEGIGPGENLVANAPTAPTAGGIPIGLAGAVPGANFGIAPGSGGGGVFGVPPIGGGGGGTPGLGGGGGTPGDGTTPPGDTTTPPGEATTPPGNGITPPGGTVTPPGGTVTPPGGGTVVPSVPGVPEPATWLTMLLGFIATGAVLRRRARGVRAHEQEAEVVACESTINS